MTKFLSFWRGRFLVKKKDHHDGMKAKSTATATTTTTSVAETKISDMSINRRNLEIKH